MYKVNRQDKTIRVLSLGVMKFIQQQAMECFSMDSGGANHVPPLRCRSPRRPVRGLGLGRSSGGALHEHDGHHFYSGPCAPLIYSPKTQIYFIHYAFPGAESRSGAFNVAFIPVIYVADLPRLDWSAWGFRSNPHRSFPAVLVFESPQTSNRSPKPNRRG